MTNTLKTFHATLNEETKRYEMSQNWFNKMIENLPEGCDWKKNAKQPNLYAIMKAGKRIAVIEITAKAPVKTKTEIKNEAKKAPAEKAKKVSRETSAPSGHKTKNAGYIVIYKNKTDKKETKNTNMTTCAEIKAFLKTVSKKQLEYLRIYDENNNECRKSAWVG